MLNHQQLILALTAMACVDVANGQDIKPGRPAPAEVVQSLKATAPVTIGSASVRPLVTPASDPGMRLPQGAIAAPGTTFVVRVSDNLVGVSTNDLVVVYPDTGAVIQSVSGKGFTTKAYPDLGLVVIHAANFDDIEPLQQGIAKTLPNAKFDLPVRYFRMQTK
jgi:hypothetical protein